MVLGLVTAMRSETGPHRAANEDSAAVGPAFALVADGVGGHAGGDVASWTVTHRLLAALGTRDVRGLGAEQLRELVAVANADLVLRTRHAPGLAGMGTTLTAIACGADEMRVVHVGDSRAYRVHAGAGEQVTRDDSYVQLLLDAGSLTAEEAWHHPDRNVILGSLSGDVADAADLTVLAVPAVAGDRWLLATDGLTDHVPEPEILAALRDHDPQAAVDTLVEAALAAGSTDNVTVLVAHVAELQDEDGRGDVVVAGAAAEEHLGHVGDLSAPPA